MQRRRRSSRVAWMAPTRLPARGCSMVGTSGPQDPGTCMPGSCRLQSVFGVCSHAPGLPPRAASCFLLLPPNITPGHIIVLYSPASTLHTLSLPSYNDTGVGMRPRAGHTGSWLRTAPHRTAHHAPAPLAATHLPRDPEACRGGGGLHVTSPGARGGSVAPTPPSKEGTTSRQLASSGLPAPAASRLPILPATTHIRPDACT